MLTAEEYKYVLTEVCLEKPTDGCTDEVAIKAYKKWMKADEMALCYMLASMSNVLQHLHQSCPTAYDIMYSLKEMFSNQDRAARHVTMKELFNTKIVEGTSVRDHVLKMMGHLNELQILGVEIDGETQIDIIIQSLTDSFENFCLNYNMKKLSFSLAELLEELQVARGLLKKSPSVDVAEKSSVSKPKGKKKQKKAQNRKKVPQGGNGPQRGVKRPTGKCFHCKQVGHWKKKCPTFLNKVNNKEVPRNQAVK